MVTKEYAFLEFGGSIHRLPFGTNKPDIKFNKNGFSYRHNGRDILICGNARSWTELDI